VNIIAGNKSCVMLLGKDRHLECKSNKTARYGQLSSALALNPDVLIGQYKKSNAGLFIFVLYSIKSLKINPLNNYKLP
jgi:hypothetical protein